MTDETTETEDALRELEQWRSGGDISDVSERSMQRAVVALRAAVQLERCHTDSKTLKRIRTKSLPGFIKHQGASALLFLRGEGL